MEWIPMILPILTILVCLVWFRNKTLWWEVSIPLAVVAFFILIFKFSAESIATSDTEYWSGYVTKAEYYEDWNERVSCRHPKYCTRTVSNGNGGTRTETYQCGYMHAYDVDYHPEYWVKTDNNGIQRKITRSQYKYYVKLFDNQGFVNLNRHYHSNDGDKYQSNWKGTDETIDILVSKHDYENRVQASHSVFNYKEVDTSDIRRYKLFEYPQIKSNHHQRHILGVKNNSAERKMEILNAKLGKKKQVKAFIMIYKDQPIKAAQTQEEYWKGGNKNEFVVCIGTDNKDRIKWVHIISWNLNKTLNIEIRNWVMKKDNLDLNELIDYMYPEIEDKFKRQPFSDFSYLKVDLTNGQLIWVWIISFILSVGLGFFIVLNPFEEL